MTKKKQTKGQGPRPPHVIWSEAERAAIIARAVDLQRDHPELSGLPLLRAVIATLPTARRRKLIAVTLVPWFEPGVAAETRRRELEIKDGARRTQNDGLGVELVAEWLRRVERADAGARRAREEMIELLKLIHGELSALNEKFGRPPPSLTLGVAHARTHANGPAGPRP